MPKFPLRSISWELIGRLSPNFIYTFILVRSSLGLLHAIFGKFVPELWPLIYAIISFPLNFLRIGVFHQILYMHSYSQDLRLGYHSLFFAYLYQSYGPWFAPKFCFFSYVLRTNGQNFTKFYICIHIDKIYVGIVTHHFIDICTRVMALDLLQKFVFAQCLENKWTDFDQTLCNYLYWQDLRFDF